MGGCIRDEANIRASSVCVACGARRASLLFTQHGEVCEGCYTEVAGDGRRLPALNQRLLLLGAGVPPLGIAGLVALLGFLFGPLGTGFSIGVIFLGSVGMAWSAGVMGLGSVGVSEDAYRAIRNQGTVVALMAQILGAAGLLGNFGALVVIFS